MQDIFDRDRSLWALLSSGSRESPTGTRGSHYSVSRGSSSKIAVGVVHHAYRGIERNDDLLQGNIRASEKYPDTLRAGTIVSLVNSTVSAGADTTAGTMSTILYLLMKHSRARECLLKELQDARSQGRMSAPIRYVEVERLPYLDAVVKESLRLNPPLAVPLERVVPAQGCSLNGLKIPGGTIVGCTGTVIQSNQANKPQF
ncbi:hypothetical protein JX266_010833 [Neoarthrinium moseri]|nr:hypothetical protein JX266_010833 [Neoarthrinium moseri]